MVAAKVFWERHRQQERPLARKCRGAGAQPGLWIITAKARNSVRAFDSRFCGDYFVSISFLVWRISFGRVCEPSETPPATPHCIGRARSR